MSSIIPFEVNLRNLLLDELSDRGGFDGWWTSIDADIRQEIEQELSKIILSEINVLLDKPYENYWD